MVKIKLNNIDFDVPEGLTILAAAGKAGFKIPTLCYREGLPHYSSCMVCMVKDNRTNGFIPSCSAMVQDGMDIDISGEEVVSLRLSAIELLLSEHRAECEAPCKVVCPAGYNIPLMNRLLAANDTGTAIQLAMKEQKAAEFMCIECPGYCENACRRKKVDIPVSIRNMQIFVSKQIILGDETTDVTVKQSIEEIKKSIKSSQRFSSRIGKVEASELEEWLKESSNDLSRQKEIENFYSAVCESKSCMHCDCRASENCKLRDIAEEFSVKDPRGKHVNSPIEKKINQNTGLIFENAKCIKCGLCVRLCEEYKDEPSLCFIHRGFVSIISEPLTEEFDNILIRRSKEVVDVCPTGALSLKNNLLL